MALSLIKFSASFRGKPFSDKSVENFFEDNVISVSVVEVTIQAAKSGRVKSSKSGKGSKLSRASRNIRNSPKSLQQSKSAGRLFGGRSPKSPKRRWMKGKSGSAASSASVTEGGKLRAGLRSKNNNMSLRKISSARKSVARKLSNMSFVGNLSLNMGLGRDQAIFLLEIKGRKGSYTVEKEHKHFRRLHDSLKSKFPQLKQMIKTFPKIGYFSLPEPEKLEEHRQFFQKYLETLMKLKPRPADLNRFLDIISHAQELKGKKRTGFNCLEDFELMKRIGEGSFGTVYLVRAIETDEIFAMKVLKKAELRRKQQVEHTLTEMKVMSISDHPFIVSLKFAFHTEDRLFMVSEYCPGGELFFHLKSKRTLPEATVKFYSAEIALALSYLHERDILYRDLKPENILLDADGHVLLTDFGLSRENCKTDRDAKTFCGTPEYLSPEMLIHRETREGYGKGVDWWSLGILVYEMLYGLPPFYHKNLKKMCERILHKKLSFPDRKVSASLEAKDLIKGLLNRKVKDRLGVVGAGFMEVKSHPFYKSIDWGKLYRKELKAPFRPDISDDRFNVDNFDKEFTAKPAKLSFDKDRGKSSANKSMMDLEDEFENFDYTFFEKNEGEVLNDFYE